MDARNARRLCYLLFPAYYLTTFLTMNPPEWPAEPAATPCIPHMMADGPSAPAKTNPQPLNG